MKGSMILLFMGVLVQLGAQNVVGDWEGKLSYQGVELIVIFHVQNEDGKYAATMDSPDQGAMGIPVESTTYEDGKLILRASDIGMEYTAELDENGENLNGTFIQQGVSIVLNMTRKGQKKSP
jgi:hypothetical protein